MEYINQFLSINQLARFYIDTNEDVFLTSLQIKCVCNVMLLVEFIKTDYNVFIWNGIYVIYSEGIICIFDKEHNYIKISVLDWFMVDVFIYNINEFNKTWSSLHIIFAELLVGDIKLSYDRGFYRMENHKLIEILLDGFSVYDTDGKIQTLRLI